MPDRDLENVENIEESMDYEPLDDAEKAAALGGIGGAATGAVAGSLLGPAGTIAGAVIGGLAGAAASGVAVAAVDKVDNDDNPTGIGEDVSVGKAQDVTADPNDPNVVIATVDEVVTERSYVDDDIHAQTVSSDELPTLQDRRIHPVVTGQEVDAEEIAEGLAGDRTDETTDRPLD